MSIEQIEGVNEAADDAAVPRRKRRIGWIIGLVVTVVVIVIGLLIAEAAARSYAEQYVRDQIVTVFDLPEDQPMDVAIGPGSVIVQYLAGSIDSIDVSISDLVVGELSGDIVVRAEDVPLDADLPLSSLDVAFAMTEDDLSSLAGLLGDLNITSVALLDDAVEIGTRFDIFGFAFPVAVQLAPSAVDGALYLDPAVITLNGAEISVADLRNGPLASVANLILASRTVCVAEYLPAAFTVTGVTISDDRLRLDFSAADVALGSPEFTTRGTCG